MAPQDKLPAMQFYPGDWRKDPGVQALDYHDRGVWWECLCMMHESSQRGRLVLNGRPMPDAAIAQNLGIPEAEWKQTRSRLEAYGVASVDEDGTLYNRRMVRDDAKRARLVEAGRKGGKRSKPKPRRSDAEAKKEANRSPSVSSSTSVGKRKTSLSSDFEALWALCRRGSKKKALAEYRRAVPKKVSHDELLEAWKAQVASASEEQFVPHLFRWIRDERWDERPPLGKNGTGNGGQYGLARPLRRLKREPDAV